jgi:hypothetical protein
MSEPAKKTGICPVVIIGAALAGIMLGHVVFLASQAVTLSYKVNRLGYQLDRIERTIKGMDK